MKRLVFLASFCLSFLLLVGCGNELPKEQSAAEVTPAQVIHAPFSESEYLKFLEDIPEITRITNPAKNGGKEVSPEDVTRLVNEAAESLGWKAERFYYVYTQAMAVLSLDQLAQMESQMESQMADLPEEQRKAMMASMNKQMDGQMEKLRNHIDEQVASSEQEIIRANLDGLYQALGIK